MTLTAEQLVPEVGEHCGVSADQYHRWDAASNSRLNDLKRSPLHMRERILNPPEPTPALILGTAIHMAILEPEPFVATYQMAEPCCERKKNGEICGNPGINRQDGRWYCGVHSRNIQAFDDYVQVISAADYETCRRISESVQRHKDAAAILDSRYATELSIAWDDGGSGVRCKARLDVVSQKFETIADIKTTRDASRDQFQRSIFQYGYHRQAAHYLSGARAVCPAVDWQHFVFIAVEKEPPYAVGVYRLLDEVIDAGRDELDILLARYGQCQATGVYPAYGDDVVDIGLPAYAWKQLISESNE